MNKQQTTTDAPNVRENGLPVYETADGRMWVQSLLRDTGDSRAMWMRALEGRELGHSALIATAQLRETGARWFLPPGAVPAEAAGNIRYKYLWCWDFMMHSSVGWMENKQEEAAADNAPEDAIHKDVNGKWCTFSDVRNPETQLIIDRHMRHLFGVPA